MQKPRKAHKKHDVFGDQQAHLGVNVSIDGEEVTDF